MKKQLYWWWTEIYHLLSCLFFFRMVEQLCWLIKGVPMFKILGFVGVVLLRAGIIATFSTAYDSHCPIIYLHQFQKQLSLKSWHITLSSTIFSQNAVLALDSSALDIDQVENLIKFCPTKEEMETLKVYTSSLSLSLSRTYAHICTPLHACTYVPVHICTCSRQSQINSCTYALAISLVGMLFLYISFPEESASLLGMSLMV